MNKMFSAALTNGFLVLAVCGFGLVGAPATVTATEIAVDAANVLHANSPWIYGACLEDVNHEIYGGLYDQRLYGESFEEPCPVTGVAGWTVYGGRWATAAGGVGVAVAADFGAKLVRQLPPFADGSVEFDLRFNSQVGSGTNAGVVLRVQNAGVGADAFDGYEISLASDGRSLTLGRHQQNFASLQTAALVVSPLQWQHLRVVLNGGHIQAYLNGSTTATIDYTDAHPLPSGSVGLRTWGSNVQFQNFKSVAGGQEADNTFVGISAPAVSGLWDAVQTGSARATFSLDTRQPYNGNASQCVQFTGGTGSVGVANRGLNRWGISVTHGSTYSGRVYLRASRLQGAVTVSLQSVDGTRTYASRTFSNVSDGWAKFPFALTSSADDPNARFAVTIDAPGTLWIDQAVLLDPPGGQFHGVPVRGDIADAMMAGKLSFVRYGGTAVNSPEYRWKSMIGDPDLRPPYQGNWHPYTSNGFGIEQFVAFCEQAGIVPAFAINVEETPQDMADMIQYLNGDASTTWGNLRAANGHPKPYGVRYIEIGNEEVIWGDIAADYDRYIHRFQLLAAAMKQADPNLVFINAAWWRGNNANCQRVFQALEGLATYWDFHFWTDDADAGQAVGTSLDEAKQLFQRWVPGAKMKVVIFEENGNLHNVRRALGHATTLNAVRRHGDFVVADCEANGLQPWLQNDNGWDQGHIFFTPGQVWGMPPYYAQQMASANHEPTLIESQVVDGTGLDVTATKSLDGRTLCLHVVNLASTSDSTQLKISNFPGVRSVAQAWTLAGNPNDTNSPTGPTAIQPVVRNIGSVGSSFTYTFPASSYTVLRLTAEPVTGGTPGQTSPDRVR